MSEPDRQAELERLKAENQRVKADSQIAVGRDLTLDERSHGQTSAASTLLRERGDRAADSLFSDVADAARPRSSRRARNDRGGIAGHHSQDGFAALQH